MSPRAKENTERLNIFLPSDVVENLKDIGREKGMSLSGLIRMIVFEYLAEQKK